MNFILKLLIYIGLSTSLGIIGFTGIAYTMEKLIELGLWNWKVYISLTIFAFTIAAIELYLIYEIFFNEEGDF